MTYLNYFEYIDIRSYIDDTFVYNVCNVSIDNVNNGDSPCLANTIISDFDSTVNVSLNFLQHLDIMYYFFGNVYNEVFCDINDTYFNVFVKGKPKDALSCNFLNARSLANKFDEIKILLSTAKLDVFCISESWLDQSFDDKDLNINGYNIVRSDRNRNGGGLVSYIRESLSFKTIILQKNPECKIETQWLEIYQNKEKIIIGNVYRPPSSSVSDMNNFYNEIESVLNLYPHEHFMMGGDFNLDAKSTAVSNPVQDIESIFNLKQLISKPTRVTAVSCTTLDLIFTNNETIHLKSNVYESGISDHYMVYTFVKLRECSNNSDHNTISFKNYENFDPNIFRADIIHAVNDILSKNLNSFDDIWHLFKAKFLEISEIHAPTKTIRVKNRYNPWIDKEILILMYRRDFLKRKAINNHLLWKEYKSIRNKVHKLCKLKKKAFFDNLIESNAKDSKSLWKSINKLTGKSVQATPSPHISADNFNEFFATIGANVANKFGPLDSNYQHKIKGAQSIYSFNFKNINCSDLLKQLKKLDSGGNIDVLGFDSKLLHLSCDILAPLLTKLFNISLNTSYVHDDFKFARTTPIYKGKGDRDSESNYRPISVISHLAKLLEREVQKQLLAYLYDHDFISTDQSAYRKGHNTQTSLHKFIDDIIDNICDDLYTGTVFLDIQKCFDTINHDILFQKLNHYGISKSPLSWFRSYLTNRKQLVRCHNTLSSVKDINIGVPQGTVLGPILFLIYINDLPQNINLAKCNIYADDTAIYSASNSISDLNLNLQVCLDDAVKWYNYNRLSINSSKSMSMLFTTKNNNDGNALHFKIGNDTLPQVDKTDYLGLRIDQNLLYDQHILKMCTSINLRLSKFRRLRSVMSFDTARKVIETTIQPLFDYAITLWGFSSNKNINKIQRLQHQAARIIFQNFDYVNTRGEDLLTKLKWQNILERRNYFMSVLTYKCLNEQAPTYLSDYLSFYNNIRSSDRPSRIDDSILHTPKPNKTLKIFESSFQYQSPTIWNNLPQDIRNSPSISSFKNMYKKI
jgi:hypothetical protein